MKMLKNVLAVVALLLVQNGFADKVVNVSDIPQDLRIKIRGERIQHYVKYSVKQYKEQRTDTVLSELELLNFGEVLELEYLFYPQFKDLDCSSTCSKTKQQLTVSVSTTQVRNFINKYYQFEFANDNTTQTTTTNWLRNIPDILGSTQTLDFFVDRLLAYYKSSGEGTTSYHITFKTSNSNQYFTYFGETGNSPDSVLQVIMNSSQTAVAFKQLDFGSYQLKTLDVTISTATGNKFTLIDYECMEKPNNPRAYNTCLLGKSNNVTIANVSDLVVVSSLVITVHSTTGEMIDYQGRLLFYSTPTISYQSGGSLNRYYADMKKIPNIKSGDYIDFYALRLFEPEISTSAIATKDSLELKWTKKPFHSHYQIYQKGSPDILLNATPQSSNTYKHAGLGSNTTYTYYVVSCKQATVASCSSDKRSDYFSFKTTAN